MERINGLDINKTDRVYKMESGRMIKIRVLKKEVLKECASFTISCFHVDEKGKALIIVNECEDLSHVLAPPHVVTIPFNAIENPIDVLQKQINGYTFTKTIDGKEVETVIKGRLEIDDAVFKTMEDLNNLEEQWSKG